ncbi:uncharacterized protein DUF559 [Nocardioides albertanoniae]|uniref:Uncharacterized protein DUF559 n=1 Tax=Nocardioides albertanoniae TaxID=1175486 RepID=A0A543ADN7_9ACTN|nr:DUF559 domain-containing protein [Nocardioides albertanoniae]TQL70688.1 uncharacterized protein DUF559 [Nocardioides albertanoniae]
MNMSLVKTDSNLPERPFTAVDVQSMAINRYALDQAISHGDVRRPFRGVYLPSKIDDDPATRAAALVSVVSSHQVISDRSAAWVHGIDAFSLTEEAQPPPVETCAVRGHTRTRRPGTDGRTRDLVPDDIVVLGGVPVTTPLRTALDLGCNLNRREAMAVLDEFAKKHGVSRSVLSGQLSRFKGRRGVLQLRDLIPLVSSHTESQRESWVKLAIRDAGLPLPEAQVWVDVEGIPTYRLDFAYRLARVAIEYDGEDHDNEDQHIYDEERRGWLIDHGWTIIIVRKGDFTGDRLLAWLREIKDALTPTYSSRRF